MKCSLTRTQRSALDMMETYGRLRQNRRGLWSHYPHGGFNSATIWRLNERGLCGISVTGSVQITKAGVAALSSDPQPLGSAREATEGNPVEDEP